jgi:hypothetical protein
LVENINILKGLIEFFDDGYLLIVELNLMPADNVQKGVRCQAAQILLVRRMLILNDTKHP